MIPDLLQIVNTSLLSDVFPQTIKTAVIKPLLKRRNLDTPVMNNYRPISNLPILSEIKAASGVEQALVTPSVWRLSGHGSGHVRHL